MVLSPQIEDQEHSMHPQLTLGVSVAGVCQKLPHVEIRANLMEIASWPTFTLGYRRRLFRL